MLVLLEEKPSGSTISTSPDTEGEKPSLSLEQPLSLDEQDLSTQTTSETHEKLSQTIQDPACVLEDRKRIEEELESLNSPCELEFSICIRFQEAVVGRAKKKVKVSQGRPLVKGKGLVCLEMIWLSGGTDSKDKLHQLLQYLKNKLDRL